MTRCTPLVALVALLVPWLNATGQESPKVAEEMQRLRGTFALLSGQADGEIMPAMMLSGMVRVAEGDVITVTLAGQLFMKANFTIDPSKSPRTIDYDMTGGFTAGQKQYGIYRTSGDTVAFCFGSPVKPRPTEFASASGSGVTCTVWKRQGR